MPIRNAIRRFWDFVIPRDGERPGRAPRPERSGTPPTSRPADPPPAPALTRGSVRLQIWVVGDHVVVAGSAEEAARALDRLADERDRAVGDEARRLRDRLRKTVTAGDALRVAV